MQEVAEETQEAVMEVQSEDDENANKDQHNIRHKKTTPITTTTTTPSAAGVKNGGDDHVAENGLPSSSRQKAAGVGGGSGSKVFVSHSPEGSIAARVVNSSDRG